MQIVIPNHINKGWLARTLWPDMKPQSARAKFHNKYNNECRMRFSDDEIKKIQDLIK